MAVDTMQTSQASRGARLVFEWGGCYYDPVDCTNSQQSSAQLPHREELPFLEGPECCCCPYLESTSCMCSCSFRCMQLSSEILSDIIQIAVQYANVILFPGTRKATESLNCSMKDFCLNFESIWLRYPGGRGNASEASTELPPSLPPSTHPGWQQCLSFLRFTPQTCPGLCPVFQLPSKLCW